MNDRWQDVIEGRERWAVVRGDCLDVMRQMPDGCLDSCVTDPPYELTSGKRGGSGSASLNVNSPAGRSRIGTGGGGFMGKAWDATGISQDPDLWREVLRVLKPGAHLLAFGGTRTAHRMICAIEDAGFEIRDCIDWCYGSGFPKSLSLEDIREGWGTALKPAHEPIVVARKPLIGTVSANMLAFGTGGINVDGCRVDWHGPCDAAAAAAAVSFGESMASGRTRSGSSLPTSYVKPEYDPQALSGRWPPNFVLTHSPGCKGVGEQIVQGGWFSGAEKRGIGFNGGSSDCDGTLPSSQIVETVPVWECVEGCPVALLDAQSGELTSGANPTRRGTDKFRGIFQPFAGQTECEPARGADTGTASRFFPTFEWTDEDFEPFRYCAKASVAEREAGCEGLPKRTAAEVSGRDPESAGLNNPRSGAQFQSTRGNVHPTVKPLALMRWLVRLVTPPGGIVLDPFTGSGTTGKAAYMEGFHFVGCELEPAHVEIARARIEPKGALL